MNALTKFRKQNLGGGDLRPSPGKISVPVETGHYVTKEQRSIVAQEIKKSHFIFGNDKGNVSSTYHSRGLQTPK